MPAGLNRLSVMRPNDGHYALASNGSERPYQGTPIVNTKPRIVEANTEARAGETEMVAQHFEQRRIAIRSDLDRTRDDSKGIGVIGPR